MRYALGRVIDHLDLRTADFDRSRRFYRAIFEALDHGDRIEEGPDHLNVDELYVSRLREGGAATTGLHLCFQALDRATVQAFHAAGLAAGGRDNGPPGERDYHPGYYAAFLLDPDGNNVEAKVDLRVVERSAAEITVETTD
ncbi:MAG: VOC family protein [Myxococcota bacterium]